MGMGRSPLTEVEVDGLGGGGKQGKNQKDKKKPSMETTSNPKKTNQWQYITAWHDKRATELFGGGKAKNVGGRRYDKSYDIEYKSDNFSKKPRTQGRLEGLSKQMDKDIANAKLGQANPHWHFEHDPTQAPEMKPLLDKLNQNGIPWTSGHTTPF